MCRECKEIIFNIDSACDYELSILCHLELKGRCITCCNLFQLSFKLCGVDKSHVFVNSILIFLPAYFVYQVLIKIYDIFSVLKCHINTLNIGFLTIHWSGIDIHFSVLDCDKESVHAVLSGIHSLAKQIQAGQAPNAFKICFNSIIFYNDIFCFIFINGYYFLIFYSFRSKYICCWHYCCANHSCSQNDCGNLIFHYFYLFF